MSSCTTIGGVGSGRIRTDLRASQSWQHTHTHTHTQHRQPYRLIIGFDYVVKMSSAIRRYPIALQVEHHIKPVAVPPAVLGSNIFARPAADPPISPTNAYCYLAQVRGGGCLRRHRRALPMNGLLFVDIAENRRTKYAGKCVENRQTHTHTLCDLLTATMLMMCTDQANNQQQHTHTQEKTALCMLIARGEGG